MLHRPTPVELHKEVLQFYGTAYSLNGVQRSTAMDAKGDNADPVKIGFASLVILFALAACMMGVYVVMR